MSKEYRLMIYFAHSTLVMYEKEMLVYKGMSIAQFRERNPEEVQRVCDEALSIFNYELSWAQMDKAIAVFLKSKYSPLSVLETEVYKPTLKP